MRISFRNELNSQAWPHCKCVGELNVPALFPSKWNKKNNFDLLWCTNAHTHTQIHKTRIDGVCTRYIECVGWLCKHMTNNVWNKYEYIYDMMFFHSWDSFCDVYYEFITNCFHLSIRFKCGFWCVLVRERACVWLCPREYPYLDVCNKNKILLLILLRKFGWFEDKFTSPHGIEGFFFRCLLIAVIPSTCVFQSLESFTFSWSFSWRE